MNLDDFNIKELGKNLFSNNAITNFVAEFVKELSNYLQNNKKENENNMDKFNKEMQQYYNEREEMMNTTKLEEEKKYVVSGIRDNTIKVVDIENGNEIKIYVATVNESLKRLKNEGIYNKIYAMDKSAFLNLNLTDNIIMKDNR